MQSRRCLCTSTRAYIRPATGVCPALTGYTLINRTRLLTAWHMLQEAPSELRSHIHSCSPELVNAPLVHKVLQARLWHRHKHTAQQPSTSLLSETLSETGPTIQLHGRKQCLADTRSACVPQCGHVGCWETETARCLASPSRGCQT